MSINQTFNKEAESLQQGDTRAAEVIFDHFVGPIHSFFMAQTRHRETAQDLTQEVFLKVIKSIGQFDRKSGNFTAWIWQIARNALIDFFRLKKPSYLADMSEEGNNIPEERSTVQDTAYFREIMNIIETFPQEDQELFEMHFIADVSYADLSRITGKSETALRVAIHRFRKKLQDRFHD